MNSFAGTGSLIRLVLRRDRIQLPIWIVVITVLVASTASAFSSLYPDIPSRLEFAASVEHTPALLALTGPAFDLSTIGGLTAWRIGGIILVLSGLMSLFAVVRHTRADEQAGRLELIGSACVGHRAPLTASLLVVLGANAVLALLIALSLLAQGLPVAGSWALGVGAAAAGCVFGSIAAITAQLTENARTSTGIAIVALGLSFLLRAAGDSSGEDGPVWLSWLSPLGWSQRIRPFADERWWVLVLPLTVVVVLVSLAYILVARRDIGAGLFPARPGPASAAPTLSGAFGLAWRLQRATLFAWLLGFIVFGAAIGSIAQGVVGILDSSPQLKQAFVAMGGQQGLVDSFIAAVMGIIGLVVAAYSVQATLRVRSEEADYRAEFVLATALGRIRFMVSHVMFAVLGSALLLAITGLAMGITYGLSINDVSHQIPRLMGAAITQLPAVLVLTGVVCVLFGLLPRLSAASWAVLIAMLLLGQLGPLFRLDQWVMDISPFEDLPKVPGEQLTFAPVAWLTGIALVLILVGLAGFRRRDLGGVNG